MQRRSAEITWFTRGIDAGGDHPSEFGTDGEAAFRGVAEAAAFLQSYEDLLGREAPSPSPKELQGARQSIEQITGVVEGLIGDLLSIGDDVRREAMAAFEARGGQTTDDGLPPPRALRVGRNDPCPCGSGKKWKRCCGAGAPSVQ